MQQTSFADLPEECAQLIINEAITFHRVCETAVPCRNATVIQAWRPYHFLKQRITLALLDRRTLENWRALDSAQLQQWLKDIADAFDSRDPCQTSFCWQHPVLRVAALSPLVYAAMRTVSQRLRLFEQQIMDYRYRPVGATSSQSRHLRLEHTDYKTMKPTLRRLERYCVRLRPYERLLYYMTLQQFARVSANNALIVPRRAPKEAAVAQLYVYDRDMEVEKPSRYNQLPSGHHVARFVPLMEAVRRGGVQTDQLWVIKHTQNTGQERTLAGYWRHRVKLLHREARPLRRLAREFKKRSKQRKS